MLAPPDFTKLHAAYRAAFPEHRMEMTPTQINVFDGDPTGYPCQVFTEYGPAVRWMREVLEKQALLIEQRAARLSQEAAGIRAALK